MHGLAVWFIWLLGTNKTSALCFIAGLLTDWEGWEWMFDREWNKDATETNIACRTHTHKQFSEQNTINNHSRVESNESVLVSVLKHRLHGPDISHFYLKINNIYIYSWFTCIIHMRDHFTWYIWGHKV